MLCASTAIPQHIVNLLVSDKKPTGIPTFTQELPSETQKRTLAVMPRDMTSPEYNPLPGQMGNLTSVQQSSLARFKKEIVDEDIFVKDRMDSAFLLRYLRARKFDVAKAKEMLISAEQWRKEFEVDDLVENFKFTEKAEVNKIYPQYYHKTDKDGRPVYIEQLGKLDVKELYRITTPERLLKHFVYQYEQSFSHRLPACSSSSGHPVDNFLTILDLRGVSLSKFLLVKDYVMKAASIGQNRYPETMGKFYIINAPWGFSMIWSVITPWLDPVTVTKISILGSSYESTLMEQISKENLPKEFGGACECAEGCSNSDVGPWNQKYKATEEVTIVHT